MSESDNPLAVGIDFGGTSVKIGVSRADEILELAEPIETRAHPDAVSLIDAMSDQVASFREKYAGIAAVGAGVPGLVDFDRGHTHELTNVRGWEHLPFRDMLAERTGLPTTIDNDANCMVYAEWRYGAGRGMKNIVALTLGTGIGGGLVLDDRLYRGSQFGAGEIGQMSLDFAGKDGPYGNTGAIECYMGNQRITELAIAHYAKAGIEKSPEECTPKALADAAASGDETALAIWNQLAEWLGTVLSGIVWLLNPDAVVIGGGVAKAGDLLFEPLREKVRSTLSPVLQEHMQFLPARFGNEAGIIGSAAQAVDAIARA